jgi:hypothetical protein
MNISDFLQNDEILCWDIVEHHIDECGGFRRTFDVRLLGDEVSRMQKL